MLDMSDDKDKKSGRKRKAQNVQYVIKPDPTKDPTAAEYLEKVGGVGIICSKANIFMDWTAQVQKLAEEQLNPPSPLPNPLDPPPDPMIASSAEEAAFF